jgi:hypothetical protein
MMKQTIIGILVVFSIFLSGCSSDAPAGLSCNALSGTPWTPSVPGGLVASTNHDSSVTLSTETKTATGTIIGLSQAAPSTVEIPIDITMDADLGAYGSVTLVAEVSNYPDDLAGSAFPMLVSLSDGTDEYIKMARTGSGGDCAASGYYTCSSGSCVANSNCTVTSTTSAYIDRAHWEQHQAPNITATNAPSTNMFPTCNWAGGSGLNPACAFTSTFFGGTGKLRHPGTYQARYVLISDSYASVTAGHTATLTVRAIRKTDTTSGGAVDINLIFVGNKTINDSRTDVGQRNMNTLVSNLATMFAQTGTDVKIGSVNPIEWQCANGGDSFSSLKTSQLSDMFAASSSVASAASEGKALNVFLVSTITDDQGAIGSGFTILGFDGAIGGPPTNGTAVSGVTVATFDALSTYNPSCPASTAICPLNQQDADFHELGVAIAHELGHFFGMNHLSELAPDVSHPSYSNDIIADTPVCTATAGSGSSAQITISSCLNTDSNLQPPLNRTCNTACTSYNSSSGVYCPTITECQFNHVMWWTSKNFTPSSGAGDGNLFSTDSGILINFNSIVQ